MSGSRAQFRTRVVLLLLLVFLAPLVGCGAILTIGIVGGVAASGKGGGGGGANTAPAVASAAIGSDTSSGTVLVTFTITDNEGDAVPVEIRFTTDPNESSAKPFSKVATGTFTLPGGAIVSSPLPGGPGGISYQFLWNTAQDLGAVITPNARVQLVLSSDVGFTVSSFTVDNTGTPLVVSVTPSSLPSGASAYSDDQQSGSFVPFTVVLQQAQAANVQLAASVSFDGGVTFPTTAIGKLVDSQGTVVPLGAVPTSAGGTSYTFQLSSLASSLGTNGQQTAVVRMIATGTKASAPRLSAPFDVNNAFFTGSVVTPQPQQITDKVNVSYQLVDFANGSLDVEVLFTLTGQSPFSTALEIVGQPSEGTKNLSAQVSGKFHTFVWNAFQDMVVTRGVTAAPNVKIELFVTRRSTQIRKGPFFSNSFSIDQRLIQTVFNKNSTVNDDIAAKNAELFLGYGFNTPAPGVALNPVSGAVFFAERDTNRVRRVVLGGANPQITTAVGGGFDETDGTLASDFDLRDPSGVAVAPPSGGSAGALFVIGRAEGAAKIFRVDGLTPIVQTIVNKGRDPTISFNAISFEPKNQFLYYVGVDGLGNAQLRKISSSGTGDTNVAGAGTNLADGGTLNGVPANIVQLGGVRGLATDFNLYDGQVFFTDTYQYPFRVRVANTLTTGSFTIGALTSAVTIPNGTVSTIYTLPGAGSTYAGGISLSGAGVIDVVDSGSDKVFRLNDNLDVVRLAGTDVRGFSGDNGPADKASLATPSGVCPDGKGGCIVVDTGNGRVRNVFGSPPVAPTTNLITTIAGAFPNVGDGLPSATAVLRNPLGVAFVGTTVLIADTGNNRVRGIDVDTLLIRTLTGNSGAGVLGDGGLASAATVGFPQGLAVGPGGEVYLSQPGDQVVRRLRTNAQGQVIIERVAGNGMSSAPAEGGTATQQGLLYPLGLAVSGSCVVISSYGVLYAVNVSAVTASCCGVTGILPGTIRTIAGAGSASGTAALMATYAYITSIAADPSNGDIYLADYSPPRVFRIAAADGSVTPVVGTGTSSDTPITTPTLATTVDLRSPAGLSISSRGVLYMTDVYYDSVSTPASEYCRVFALNLTGTQQTVHTKVLDPGLLVPLAGSVKTRGFGGDGESANGPKARFDFSYPVHTSALVVGATNDVVLIPDTGNNRIRFVDSAGKLGTVAGGGTGALDGDGLPSENARLTIPTAIAALDDGSYAVMDTGRVRLVPADTTIVKRLAGTGAQSSTGDGGPGLNASFNYAVGSSPGAQVLLDDGPRAIAFGSIAGVGSLLAIADSDGDKVRIMNVGPNDATVPGVGTLPPGIIRSFSNPSGNASGSVGGGPEAPFADIQGLAFDNLRSLLFIADNPNFPYPSGAHGRILVVNLGSTTQTFAGGITVIPGQVTRLFDRATAGPGDKFRQIALEKTTRAILMVTGFDMGFTPNSAKLWLVNLTTSTLAAYGVGNGTPPMPLGSGNSYNGYNLAGEVPRGIAIDPRTGDAYFADRELHVVFSLPLAAPSGADPLPFAGTGVGGFSGDGGLPINAKLNAPFGVAVDGKGSILILDGGNFRVRRCRSFP